MPRLSPKLRQCAAAQVIVPDVAGARSPRSPRIRSDKPGSPQRSLVNFPDSPRGGIRDRQTEDSVPSSSMSSFPSVRDERRSTGLRTERVQTFVPDAFAATSGNTSLQGLWIQMNDNISDELTRLLIAVFTQRYPALPERPSGKTTKKKK